MKLEVVFFLESDFEDLTARLRQHAADTVQIEMIPWVNEFTKNPNDTYIHPTLKKLKPDKAQISDYRELFPSVARLAAQPKRKILITGEQGFGKTTLSQKIYLDWVEGLFTTFSIVFFIQLKFVQSGHDLVDVIIEQTPGLRDSNFEKTRLRNCINTFGFRCLIILDGSSEHSDVAKRIIKQADECCNTLVTYLPHLSVSIEQYFETVICLQGFIDEQAISYCSIMSQHEERLVLMRFCMDNFARGRLHVSPMLLLFTCILNRTVTELANDVPVADIFFRSIKFAYKKHVSSKQLDWGKFENFFRSIGTVALRCLTSNNHSFSKRELGRDIRIQALASGILTELRGSSFSIGSSDDSLLVFAHSSFKYIFGAYSLVQSIGAGTLEERLQDPIMIPLFHRPLFSHFALWFTNNGFQPASENQRRAYLKLKASIVDKIDIIELDLSQLCILYPAINVYFDKNNQDNMTLKLFEDALNMCKNIKHLLLDSSQVEFIKRISTLQSILTKIAVIQISSNTSIPLCHGLTIPTGSTQSPIIIQSGMHEQHLRTLISSFVSLNRRPKMYILSSHFQKDICMPYHDSGIGELTELHVVPNVLSEFYSGLVLAACPYLTHLSLRNLQLTHGDVSHLRESKEEGNLPKLTFLDLSGSDVKGKMAELFKSKWPKLTHLYLKQCVLDETDLKVLSKSVESISNLKVIALKLEDKAEFGLLIPSRILNVTELWLDCVKHQYDNLVDSLNEEQCTRFGVLEIYMRDSPPENVMVEQSKPSLSRETYPVWDDMRPLNVALTHLTLHRSIRTIQHMHMVTTSEYLTRLHKLDVSHSSGIAGSLSTLLCHSFPLLETLILSDCGLNPEDLECLAKASSKGRLPAVKHLDVSYNVFKSSDDLESLFTESCRWKSLVHLNVHGSSNHWFQFLNDKVRVGCLSSLQELRLSMVGRFSPGCGARWSFLKTICISYAQISQGSMLKAVRAFVEKGVFPSLDTLTLSGSTSGSYSMSGTDDSSQPSSQSAADVDAEYDYADHYDLLKRGILVRFLQLNTDEAEFLNRLETRSEQGYTKSILRSKGIDQSELMTIRNQLFT